MLIANFIEFFSTFPVSLKSYLWKICFLKCLHFCSFHSEQNSSSWQFLLEHMWLGRHILRVRKQGLTVSNEGCSFLGPLNSWLNPFASEAPRDNFGTFQFIKQISACKFDFQWHSVFEIISQSLHRKFKMRLQNGGPL